MAQAKMTDRALIQEFNLSIDDVIRQYSDANIYPRYKQALEALVDKCLRRVAVAPTAQEYSQLSRLAQLGESENLKQRVSNILTTALQNGGLPSFKISIIKTLVQINRSNKPILQSDLITELNAIVQSLDEIHSRNPNTNDLSNLLSAVAFFLDKLVDHHVIQLDSKVHLNDTFTGLTDHPDGDVAYFARYCIEAYKSIPATPDDAIWTKRLGAVIGAASALASAAGTIAAAVLTAGATTFIATATVPANLLDAYNKINDLWKTFESKDPATWYMKVRVFQAILDDMKKPNRARLSTAVITLTFKPNNFDAADTFVVMGILQELDLSMVKASPLFSDTLILETLCYIFDVCRQHNKPWLCGKALLLLLRCKGQAIADNKIKNLLKECEQKTTFNYGDQPNVLTTVHKYMINGLLNSTFEEEQITFYFTAFTTATATWGLGAKTAKLIKEVVLEAALFLSKYGVNEARNSRQVIKRLKEYPKTKSVVGDTLEINIDVADPTDTDPDGSRFVRLAYSDLNLKDQDFLTPVVNNLVRQHIFTQTVINETGAYVSANAIKLDTEYSRHDRLRTYSSTIDAGAQGSPLISPSSTDNTLIKQFLESKSKVLLLLANGGMGKTVFCKTLAMVLGRSLYDKYIGKKYPIPLDEIIPVYVHLPSVSDIERVERLIDNRLIEEFKFNESNTEMIEFLKQNQRFLFILDSYDEMKDTHQNLYISKKLGEWVKSQFIICCRISTLIDRSTYYTNFVPWEDKALESEKKNQYQEFMLTRFDSSKISQYIRTWLDLYQKRADEDKDEYHVGIWLDPATYEKYISGTSQITGLKTLVQIPLFLVVTMNALPRIVKESPDEEKIPAQNEHSLFRNYAEYWFATEKSKRTRAGTLPPVADLEGLYWVYAKSLATEMSDKDPKTYTVTWPQDTTARDLSDEQRAQREATNRIYKWYFSERPVPEVPLEIRQRFEKVGVMLEEKETKEDRDLVIIEFRGCPLVKPGPRDFAFLHSEIQLFFHTADIFDNRVTPTEDDMKRLAEMLNQM